MLGQETRKQQLDIAPGTFDIGDASEWQQESFWSFSAPAFRPVAVENPGGGRIRDKRDPDISDTVVVDGHRGRRVRLHRLAAEAWKAMVGAARAAGIAVPLLMPVSGYRSTARQRVLFAKAVKKYGSERKARRWVAKPGGSAHHSGRTIDLYLGYGISSRNVRQMRKTAAWQWLRDNAQRFGFYPYEAEPWHWEYNPPASSVLGAGTSGTMAGALGAVGSLPSFLSSAFLRGSEIAQTAAAIANGNRDANSLASTLFFARHPEMKGRKIAKHEKRLAQEWLRIRNNIVRPLLSRVVPTGNSSGQSPRKITRSRSSKSRINSTVVGRIDRFAGLIDRISAAEGFDGNWVRGVIAAESAGNPQSGKGTSGYLGLMQAYRRKRQKGDKLRPQGDQLRPEVSILSGIRKLKRFRRSVANQLRKNNIDPESLGRERMIRSTMVAYNAGPGTLKKAMQYAIAGGDFHRFMAPEHFVRALIFYGAFSTRTAMKSCLDGPQGSVIIREYADLLGISETDFAQKYRRNNSWRRRALWRDLKRDLFRVKSRFKKTGITLAEATRTAPAWLVCAATFKHGNLKKWYVDRVIAYMNHYAK